MPETLTDAAIGLSTFLTGVDDVCIVVVVAEVSLDAVPYTFLILIFGHSEEILNSNLLFFEVEDETGIAEQIVEDLY
jgi:hypothetical protein